MKIFSINNLEEFKKYEKGIDKLVEQDTGKCLFLTYDYIYSWLSCFSNGNDFIIILGINEDQKIIGFCPLISSLNKSNFGFKCKQYRNAGDGLWGYSGILIDNKYKDTIINIFNYIIKELKFHKLELGPIPGESPLIDLINLLPLRNIKYISYKDSPYINTAGTFSDYAKNNLTKKATVADVQRCIRRLSEIGQVEYRKVSKNISYYEFEQYLQVYFQMYHKQWAVNRFTKDNRFIELYKTFGYKALQKGYADFTYLSLNNKIIAFHYGFRLNRHKYYLTPTFDNDYKKYSPGKILLYHLIKESFEEHTEFDFMNSLEPYKLDWTNTIKNRIFIYIYRNLLYNVLDSLVILKEKIKYKSLKRSLITNQ